MTANAEALEDGTLKPTNGLPSSQSAVARRSAEAELRTLIARIAPSQQRLVGALRRLLRTRLPTAHELVYEYRGCVISAYSPTGRGHEGVLGIRATSASRRANVARLT